MKKQVDEFVGKIALIDCNGLKVEVEILDVTNSYGKTRYEVTPVRGSGVIRVENVTLAK